MKIELQVQTIEKDGEWWEFALTANGVQLPLEKPTLGWQGDGFDGGGLRIYDDFPTYAVPALIDVVEKISTPRWGWWIEVYTNSDDHAKVLESIGYKVIKRDTPDYGRNRTIFSCYGKRKK